MDLVGQFFVVILVNVSKITSKQHLVIEFAGGPDSDIQESRHLRLGIPATSLSDVGGDRHRSPADLPRESEALRAREMLRHLIDRDHQPMGLPPDLAKYKGSGLTFKV